LSTGKNEQHAPNNGFGRFSKRLKRSCFLGGRPQARKRPQSVSSDPTSPPVVPARWGRTKGLLMNLLLLLLLALPFACLAVLSLVAFLGVAAIAGALHVIATITSALGIAVRKDADLWHGAVGDAHPLDYIEVPR
jgi:hypothetical protein